MSLKNTDMFSTGIVQRVSTNRTDALALASGLYRTEMEKQFPNHFTIQLKSENRLLSSDGIGSPRLKE
jgi:hypothetical protein